MRISMFGVIMLFIISCQEKKEIGTIDDLNGYWQIERAEVPDVVVKNYKGGLKLDYIKIGPDSSGIRKKVKLSMMGKMKTTPNQEEIKLLEKEGDLIISCKTPYSEWTESVLHLSRDSLVIRNQDDKKYYYSKYDIDQLNETGTQ